MRLAILIRGFHFLPADRFGFPLDGRRYIDSLLANVIEPLRAEHDIEVNVATYDSPILPDVLNRLQPTRHVLCEKTSSDQISTFLQGIALARTGGAAFDRLISTRFDLTYLMPATRWNVWGDRKGLFFPWREYEHLWESERRVGDTIHVCDAYLLETFVEGLTRQRAEGRKDLHTLYRVVSRSTDDLGFIVEGFHDSNTLFCNAECYNPLYRLGNRPRLPAVDMVKPISPTAPLYRRRMYRARTMLVRWWSNAVVKSCAGLARFGFAGRARRRAKSAGIS